MNILLIGSGGREHALAWKIAQSPLLHTLFISSGNGGTTQLGTHCALDVSNHQAVVDFCHGNSINLVVIGPEAPLVAGLADDLRHAGVQVFGPSQAAAQLEGSKQFTKQLCDRKNIPTAAYGHFTTLEQAIAYVKQQGAPIVIKADGLAAGKGVTVAMDLDEAINALNDCFDGAFGHAGAEVVIEEFLQGEEASQFFLCDGKSALPFGTAQDHKRVGEGDSGPNTGGMGAYSPAPVLTKDRQQQVLDQIILPTLEGMAETGTPFCGVLYAGLMIDENGPKLIEYNVRFGDPECQVLMLRLQSDIVPLLQAAAENDAKEDISTLQVEWSQDTALTVVMAAKGYPASYKKGTFIKDLPQDNGQKAVVFHAGTARQDDRLIATGGRVLNVTARGASARLAQQAAYKMLDQVQWEDGFCRRDIGWRAIERENN